MWDHMSLDGRPHAHMGTLLNGQYRGDATRMLVPPAPPAHSPMLSNRAGSGPLPRPAPMGSHGGRPSMSGFKYGDFRDPRPISHDRHGWPVDAPHQQAQRPRTFSPPVMPEAVLLQLQHEREQLQLQHEREQSRVQERLAAQQMELEQRWQRLLEMQIDQQRQAEELRLARCLQTQHNSEIFHHPRPAVNTPLMVPPGYQRQVRVMQGQEPMHARLGGGPITSPRARSPPLLVPRFRGGDYAQPILQVQQIHPRPGRFSPSGASETVAVASLLSFTRGVKRPAEDSAAVAVPVVLPFEPPQPDHDANGEMSLDGKKKRPQCKVPGCDKIDKGRGLCKMHGGGSRCSHFECNKAARGSSGYCIRHGGGPRCIMAECPRSARTVGGYCKMHGGGRKCSVAKCTKTARGEGDLCCDHAEGGALHEAMVAHRAAVSQEVSARLGRAYVSSYPTAPSQPPSLSHSLTDDEMHSTDGSSVIHI